MVGIDLDKPIIYKDSSFREFEEGEHHVTRFCKDNVLLLVYEGVLRFSEEGVPKEVTKGEYYIQRANCHQGGERASDMPKYLYVHFDCEWSHVGKTLDCAGIFDCDELLPLMKEMNERAYGEYGYCERLSSFLNILMKLKTEPEKMDLCERIAGYIQQNYKSLRTLDEICKKFRYSKNHVINLFRSRYDMTPFEYLNDVKLKRAMYLMRVTSNSVEEISLECGFNNYSHFYRLFIRKNGLSPSKWREMIQVDPLSV